MVEILKEKSLRKKINYLCLDRQEYVRLLDYFRGGNNRGKSNLFTVSFEHPWPGNNHLGTHGISGHIDLGSLHTLVDFWLLNL